MSALATHSTNDTNKAQFLAPETHQRAGMKRDYLAILQEAVTRPGVVNEAYRAFHNFSIGNQILAAVQLAERGLPLAPIASFNAWKEKGRFVKKGEKAISLFMPVTMKSRAKDEEEGAEPSTFQTFVLRPNWFSYDQTEGEAFAPEQVIPTWDAATALAALGIEEERFQSLRGNVLGYAVERRIAVSPVNPFPHKTRFHELAHVVLGHTAAGEISDEQELSRSIEEAEAEGVAYILCTLLDLPGQAESRWYIQTWLQGQTLPEKSAKRIFGAADKILKAGRPAVH
ncbi:ArdC family protein (plasmid) [Sphaerotilaceae bacterium SBD11-9]